MKAKKNKTVKLTSSETSLCEFFKANYLDRFDDFYESKDAFLVDINTAFKEMWGCNAKVIYEQHILDALKDAERYLK